MAHKSYGMRELEKEQGKPIEEVLEELCMECGLLEVCRSRARDTLYYTLYLADAFPLPGAMGESAACT